ncbi:MAG: TonB-dependent receptor [Bacteroidales bacterium]|jgi:TonB-linked SusC/RagA family outer membrane protein|nr:TonB-dependent receptor [Bacteroidales bacterium]MCI1733113.1 TonB-dependent receptor [Bacteroidales bacterium]
MKKEHFSKIIVGFVILQIACLVTAFPLHAQRVDIHENGTTIKEVLKEITKQTGYNFIYSDLLTELNKKIDFSYRSDNEPIDKILNKLFDGTGILYSVKEKQIVLQTKALKAPKLINVRGVIKSAEGGEPLGFVVVFSKSTHVNTASDAQGNYFIKVPDDAVLVYNLMGYEPIEIKVGNRSVINVILQPAKTVLDEVMVVAYGTVKKASFTGSAATVGKDKFNDRPLTEISQALTGTTAGLQIETSNGQPGSTPNIRIRGIGSFNASNDPLVVLDGMPYDNSLTSINPNDIESITVLKDASSAALYGARAANGVLLVTTKKGKFGATRISVKYNLGLTTRQTKDYKTVGMKDYMKLYWESERNSLMYSGATLEEANAKAGAALLAGMSYNVFDMGADQLFVNNSGELNPKAKLLWGDDLNWKDAIERVGVRHDVAVSLSGANEKTDYYASVGYTDDNGYIVGSLLRRYSSEANMNTQIKKWLKVGANLNASITNSEGNQNESSGNNSNPFRFLRYVGNIFPIHLHNPNTGEYIYDDNGNKLYDFGVGYTMADGTVIPKRDYVSGNNPAIELKNIYDGYRRNTINAKTYVEVKFLKDFKFSVNVGVGENMYRGWNGTYVYKEKGNAGTSYKSNSNTTTWTANQILSYAKEIGKHHFDLMAGHESYDFKYSNQSSSMKSQIIKGSNFEFKNFAEINGIPTSYEDNYDVEGYLSRANYDYDNKYFASASYRRDGSSRFYKSVRWGNFWSVGGGWRIDREAFMKDVKFVDMLKLRVSYGVVGNDDLESYYPWRATYYPYPNGSEPGFLQSSLGNKDLSWEVSHNFDVAVEFSLFSSRLNGSLEFFNRVSSNLLFEVPQPLSAGVDSKSINAGTMYNRGLEITLDGDIYKTKDFRWSANFNATYIVNKISKLPIDPYKSSMYRIEKGHSRYEFWLRQWRGVNPQTGYNLFVADVDNPAFVWDPNELVDFHGVKCTENVEHAKFDWSGTATPKITGGFGSAINWRNFSFSFNFYYQLGGKYYDSTYGSLMSVGTSSLSYQKLHKDLLKRWSSVGDITNVARLSNGTDSKNIDATTSSRWLVSSNMLELTNLSLSYSVPGKFLKKLEIASAKLYFSADNPFLFTKRRGMFPRRNLLSGYDGNADIYLPSKTFSFGINIDF